MSLHKPLLPPQRSPKPPQERYLLHTDTLRLIFMRNQIVLESLIETPLFELAVSAVSAAQLHHACERKRGDQRLARAAYLLLRAVEICPWDAKVARRYGAMSAGLERTGVVLDGHQRQVAAHALSLNAVLVTAEPVFMGVPGLPQEDWSEILPLGGHCRRFGTLPVGR